MKLSAVESRVRVESRREVLFELLVRTTEDLRRPSGVKVFDSMLFFWLSTMVSSFLRRWSICSKFCITAVCRASILCAIKADCSCLRASRAAASTLLCAASSHPKQQQRFSKHQDGAMLPVSWSARALLLLPFGLFAFTILASPRLTGEDCGGATMAVEVCTVDVAGAVAASSVGVSATSIAGDF